MSQEYPDCPQAINRVPTRSLNVSLLDLSDSEEGYGLSYSN
jgi:hypothetical protein